MFVKFKSYITFSMKAISDNAQRRVTSCYFSKICKFSLSIQLSCNIVRLVVDDLTKLSIYRLQRASTYHPFRTVDTTMIHRYITVYKKELFHDLKVNLQEIKNYAGKSQNLLATRTFVREISDYGLRCAELRHIVHCLPLVRTRWSVWLG